ncbi:MULTISPECIES: NUDIX hydrolase [Streptosporangium]|uniref:8-oxo-dGTP pyrophosphatase MutT (NUDIX family) n=1 Tax=Streptosporangium brasiliense TaxID=47480 RepID=A0ABT9RCQ0_9ACTN|nr:NUDIX domain-containing protein [Streptosporangium brasiliense]MDP9866632.1 8-oxo-dGTP pyrophosphatase MutT (NUDIX family) [Streptosporangium brasiliense]
MTVSRDEIRAVLDRYLAAHPGRVEDVAPLTDALAGDHDLTSRKSLPLHVTCSAAAINDAGQVLMIHHRALNRWLLPGGHVEPEDLSLYGAALRELEEETGIPWQHAVSPPAHDIVPLDVDIHEIPANPVKGEPAHWHADFRFAFWVKAGEVSIQEEEVSAFAWRDRSALPTARLVEMAGTI